jgi:hypothetical protein
MPWLVVMTDTHTAAGEGDAFSLLTGVDGLGPRLRTGRRGGSLSPSTRYYSSIRVFARTISGSEQTLHNFSLFEGGVDLERGVLVSCLVFFPEST